MRNSIGPTVWSVRSSPLLLGLCLKAQGFAVVQVCFQHRSVPSPQRREWFRQHAILEPFCVCKTPEEMSHFKPDLRRGL